MILIVLRHLGLHSTRAWSRKEVDNLGRTHPKLRQKDLTTKAFVESLLSHRVQTSYSYYRVSG